MERVTLAAREHDGNWFGVLIGERNGLVASALSTSKKTLEKHLRSEARQNASLEPSEQCNIALREMIKLYEGKTTDHEVRLDLEGVSGFQKSVCQLMTEIPKGKVTSYGLIAKRIGSGPRAVGTAVARNPWPLFVPCHRVVPTSLEVGNYSIGGTISDHGCEVKRDLLEREGVPMEGDRIARRALWIPTGA